MNVKLGVGSVGFWGVWVLATCLALACGRGDDALTHSKGSPEELAQAVLDGLETRDRAALEAALATLPVAVACDGPDVLGLLRHIGISTRGGLCRLP